MDPTIQALINQTPPASKINNYRTGDSLPTGVQLNTAGYSYFVRDNRDRDNVTGKLDYNLSDKHVLNGSFAWNRDLLDRPDAAVTYSSIPPVQNDDNVKFASASWRWSSSPTLTNELRGGLNYAPAIFSMSGTLPSSFIGGLYFATPVAAASFLPQGRDTHTRSLQDNASWVKGKHTITFGYQYLGVRVRSYDYSGTVPEYDVTDPGCGCVDSSNQTRLLSNSQLPGIGAEDFQNANDLLATLAGLLNDDGATYNVTSRTSGFVPGAPWVRNFTYDNHALYVQDQWRVRKNLTATLGVRWDYYTPVNEANSLELQPSIENGNAWASLLDPNNSLQFYGNSVGQPYYQKNLKNFAPNVGLAWDPFGTGKTSVRAGYGMHYIDDQMIEVTDGFTATNPGLQAFPANYDLSGTVSQAPAIPAPPFQVPTSFATQYNLNPTTYYTLINPHLQTPYDQQFGLSIQHEIKGTIIEARYIGNHATKLLRGFDVNQENITSNGFLSDFKKAQSNGNLALAATGVFNPAFNPRIPGSQQLNVFSELTGRGNLGNATYDALIQDGEAAELAYQYTLNGENGKLNFFPNPNALSAVYLDNFSNSEYNSLQLEVRRRFQHGLELQANYVFEKWLTDAAGLDANRFEPFMDINNTALERSRPPTDLTNQFKANYAYDLPIGEGHALHLNHGWNRLLQGWTTSGNLSWVSGNPVSVISGLGTFLREDFSNVNTVDTSLNRGQLEQALQFQMTGNGPFFVPASAIGPDGRGVAPGGQPAFSGQLFYNPPPGTIGQLQRRQFDGPSVFAMDAALFKETKVNERVSVELRMEALNVFNHPTFALFTSDSSPGSVDLNVNSQQFGQISSIATTPRQLQFGVRVKF